MKKLIHNCDIWNLSKCDDKEQEIVKSLSGVNQHAMVRLVDINRTHNFNNNLVVSDSIYPTKYGLDRKLNVHNYQINVLPEFWHIFYMPGFSIETNTVPLKKFNCMMNRATHERTFAFHYFFERNLINNNIISYNCFDPNNHDAQWENVVVNHRNGALQDLSLENRVKAFVQSHDAQRYPYRLETLLDILNSSTLPLMLDDHITCESAAINSEITVVIESYVDNEVIAFSEKIFRALQIPRPWLLFCGAGSVKILRDYGFDVLDDIVDHSYDIIDNYADRFDCLMEQIDKINFNEERCIEAVTTNKKLLESYQETWPEKLNEIHKQLSL